MHDTCVYSLQPCMHAYCSGCYSDWMSLSEQCPSVSAPRSHFFSSSPLRRCLNNITMLLMYYTVYEYEMIRNFRVFSIQVLCLYCSNGHFCESHKSGITFVKYRGWRCTQSCMGMKSLSDPSEGLVCTHGGSWQIPMYRCTGLNELAVEKNGQVREKQKSLYVLC